MRYAWRYIILFEKNNFFVMNRQTFIVSDESLNSYHMVVLTAGIDYADFARNPVMYYMHDRSRGVVGRWENIRVEGKQLLMDAVFDDSTPLGQQLQKQVENNFLRCASIGFDNPEMCTIDGVQTVVKCRLREVSIVDIPANRSAVRLLDNEGNEVYTLADWLGNKVDPLRRTIKACLGLSDTANDMEILDALEMRSNRPRMPKDAVSRAVRLNLIDEAEYEQYLAMACADGEAFDELIARKEARARERVENTLSIAIRDGRISAHDKEVYKEIAELCGCALCEKVISLIPKPQSIVALIKDFEERGGQGIPPRSAWGLAEYRKYAPNELKDNPELYMELMARDGQYVPLNVDSVDYYRKHNPQYLATHPKEYQRVMAEKSQRENTK